MNEPSNLSAPAAIPVLHVCVTCRAGQVLADDDVRPGRLLHDAVQRLLGGMPAPPVALRPVTCLSCCTNGCTAAISSPGKWSYLLGHLDAAVAADLLAYGATYAASANGAVLPSRRPESLRGSVLGRMPDLVELPA